VYATPGTSAYTRRREQITPVLRQLQWRQRIELKLAALVIYKAPLNGLSP